MISGDSTASHIGSTRVGCFLSTTVSRFGLVGGVGGLRAEKARAVQSWFVSARGACEELHSAAAAAAARDQAASPIVSQTKAGSNLLLVNISSPSRTTA